MEQIYLDHAATSLLHPAALDAMLPYFAEDFGNPSSTHQFGRVARQGLMEARKTIAAYLQATEHEVLFTSGGTEANNLALIGYARANREKGNHIITTEIEHHAVLHTLDQLKSEGFLVTYLKVNEEGLVSIEDVRKALTDKTILVSVMYGNNEVGVVQPIEEIGELLLGHQAVFHTDAVQAAGLLSLDVEALNVDMMSIASHKLNGPKGVGCLYVRDRLKLSPLFFGGEQERKRRAGTENVPGAVGFAKALSIANDNREQRISDYKHYREIFHSIMKRHEIRVTENGSEVLRLPHILNVCFEGIHTDQLLMKLDLLGIAASGGSACTAGAHVPSHVINAMYGSGSKQLQEAVRFSFGLSNTEDEVRRAFEKIASSVKDERERSEFIV
ncbi:cysteine desulfurase family protein [Shouchella patagoniensis]|uniref:cysteine desulfurase family protein n=1 Tax=Shouchella patagoniensis TaxID=228576 RepID=UPI0009949252|nr:cysteine desulfurase family protein [Shouchella patagoniensis]